MFLHPAVKMEEAASMDMDNHVLDKEEGCYDHTEAAFSDDEEEVNNKGRKKEPQAVWLELHPNQLSPLDFVICGTVSFKPVKLVQSSSTQ